MSFIKTLNTRIEARSNIVIIGFILLSTLIFLLVGNPISVLIWAGTINGFILPVGLALVLLASRKMSIMGDYSHPLILQAAGWFVVAVMTIFSVSTLVKLLS